MGCESSEKLSLELDKQIEAILYLKGKPTLITEIMEITNSSMEQVETAMIELMSEYAHRHTALEIVETNQGYCLQLEKDYQQLSENLVPAELSTGTLKTLAAIALENPILQSDLITLRGSSAYQHVHDLLELGFISKRRQDEGRSYWLGTTEKFYQYFEISQLPH